MKLPALLAAALAVPALAAADHPGDAARERDAAFVQDFGPNLLSTCPNPEGVAVDPRGRVYASSFAAAPAAPICEAPPRGLRAQGVLGASSSAARRPPCGAAHVEASSTRA